MGEHQAWARHRVSFVQMAIVIEARWAGLVTKVFSVLWPGRSRVSRRAELAAARRWAADDADD